MASTDRWGGTRRVRCVLAVAAAWSLAGCSGDPEPVAEPAEPVPLESVEIRPPSPEEQALTRAIALRESGMSEQALAEFERAIEINPELTAAHLGSADLLLAEGAYEESYERYRAASELEPESFDARYGVALTLQLLGRLVEAAEAYAQALALNPDDFGANLNASGASLALNDPQAAIEPARRAVALNPESGPARINLASALQRLGRAEEAVSEYRRAAERMDLTPDLLVSMADALGAAERYEEMASTLDQLVAVAPSPAAFERLGSARFRAKRYEEAQQAFERALEMDPRYYPALNGRAVCLLNVYVWSDRTDRATLLEARRMLQRSLRVRRDQPRIVELLTRYQ
ncbi:MAG: tetratricopeptide repeat protein [Planctomycetota bacterium]